MNEMGLDGGGLPDSSTGVTMPRWQTNTQNKEALSYPERSSDANDASVLSRWPPIWQDTTVQFTRRKSGR